MVVLVLELALRRIILVLHVANWIVIPVVGKHYVSIEIDGSSILKAKAFVVIGSLTILCAEFGSVNLTGWHVGEICNNSLRMRCVDNVRLRARQLRRRVIAECQPAIVVACARHRRIARSIQPTIGECPTRKA